MLLEELLDDLRVEVDEPFALCAVADGGAASPRPSGPRCTSSGARACSERFALDVGGRWDVATTACGVR